MIALWQWSINKHKYKNEIDKNTDTNLSEINIGSCRRCQRLPGSASSQRGGPGYDSAAFRYSTHLFLLQILTTLIIILIHTYSRNRESVGMYCIPKSMRWSYENIRKCQIFIGFPNMNGWKRRSETSLCAVHCPSYRLRLNSFSARRGRGRGRGERFTLIQ